MLASPTRELERLEARAEEVSRLLKLIANNRRLLLLCRLMTEQEMTVTSLSEAVGLGQSALSQHLAKLRDEGVVAFRREGTALYYRVADQRAARVLTLLNEIFAEETN